MSKHRRNVGAVAHEAARLCELAPRRYERQPRRRRELDDLRLIAQERWSAEEHDRANRWPPRRLEGARDIGRNTHGHDVQPQRQGLGGSLDRRETLTVPGILRSR